MPAATTSHVPASQDLQGSLRPIIRGARITVVLATALALGGLAYCLTDPGAAHSLSAPQLSTVTVTAASRALLFLALMPAAIMLILTALAIYRLFGRFAAGHILDAGNASLLERIGVYLLVNAALAVATRTFVALALTWYNPPGKRQLVLSLSFNDFLLLLFGLFVFAFAKIVSEAVRIAEENRAFI